MMFGVLAAALTGLTASACILNIRVACPNGTAAVGVEVCVETDLDGVLCGITDELGIATISVPFGNHIVCVNEATLPAGATLSTSCKKISVINDAPPVVEFEIGGDICSVPPPPGECWLTGGGTVGKVKGQPHYSFGGVVYPGCSPKAADGGNWNVIDHVSELHFQGQRIIVDACSGVPTQSPKVNVNIIDFHGEGTIGGIGGNNSSERVPVTFVGRAVDHAESGAGKDFLFLVVSDASGVVLQVGASAIDPAVITTGNLQIHTTSCGN